MKTNYKVVILGGGAGGISLAARLSKEKNIAAHDIAIVDPATQHFYQPLWTLAGAGIVDKRITVRNQDTLIPAGVDWIKASVAKVTPEKNTVHLANGATFSYEYLVVATGLRLLWENIPGVQGNLGKNGMGTIYEYDQVDKVFEMIEDFEGGTAIFVMPPPPIKCAGAPQKIAYLAEEIFRKNGVRAKSRVFFATAGRAMFGVPVFSKALEKVAARKGIEPLYAHKLVSVDAARKIATFAVTDTDGTVTTKEMPYDLLHVVPQMMAHQYVADSGLAAPEGDQKGWLAVDKHSLQHLKYRNIFGIGDVTGVPNSKTGAAVRAQAPVVLENLRALMGGGTPTAQYNGYASCPLVTENGKVMLAEFGYDGKLMPTFPLDPTVERKSMWVLKRHLLPPLYWHGMLKGWA